MRLGGSVSAAIKGEGLTNGWLLYLRGRSVGERAGQGCLGMAPIPVGLNILDR